MNKQAINSDKERSWHLLLVLWLVILGMIISTNVTKALEGTVIEKNNNSTLHSSSTTINIKENYQKQLEEELKKMVKSMDGDIAIYVENLTNGNSFSINNHKMPSASLIKLFVAGAYYEAINNEEIAETLVAEEQVRAMITYSSNDAWTWLEEYIGNGDGSKGISKVTDFALRHGYKNTGRLVGAESIYSENAENLTSVEDVGKVLREIYEGTFIDKNSSKKLLSYLKDQAYTSKIPSGVPSNTLVANKTGELDNAQNDAAIIFSDNIDYILVVMCNEIIDGTKAIDNIVDISNTVYQYMIKS